MNRPGGVSLAETLLVAWMFGALLAAVAGFAGAQGRLVARSHDRTRAESLVRVARLILVAELRHLDPSDITALAGDSVRIRAIRGGGVICGADGDAVSVRYRGVRGPDPAKDSLLVIHGAATVGTAFPIREASLSAACPGGVRFEIGRTLAARGWALVFETGTYHIADGAVRYRRGGGGRQPLTEALLREGELVGEPARRLRLRLELSPDSVPALSPTERSATVELRMP